MKYPLAGDLAARASSKLVTNPTYTANPPWVTEVIGAYYDVLEDKVPAAWLPKLENVTPSPKGRRVTAQLNELGCGAYGCVLPTLDDKVVLKITTDQTETDFAVRYADGLAAPVAVRYLMVVALSDRHEGRPLNLLWRQAADHVGKAGEVIGKRADAVIDQQAILAGRAFEGIYHHEPADKIRELVGAWVAYLDEQAAAHRGTEIRPIAELFAGMATVFRRQYLLFGDVHSGNVGVVDGRWVIVDPGNVALVPEAAR